MRRAISYSGASPSTSEPLQSNWSGSIVNWSGTSGANWCRSSSANLSCTSSASSNTHLSASCRTEDSSIYEKIGANKFNKDKLVLSLKRELSQAVQLSEEHASTARALATELDELKSSTQEVKDEHEELLNDMQFVLHENEEMSYKIEQLVEDYKMLKASFDELQKEKEDIDIAFEKYKYQHQGKDDGIGLRHAVCEERVDVSIMLCSKQSPVQRGMIKETKELFEKKSKKGVQREHAIGEKHETTADFSKGSEESDETLKMRIATLEKANKRFHELEKKRSECFHEENLCLHELEKENKRLYELLKENESLLQIEKVNEGLQERVENFRTVPVGALENVADLLDHYGRKVRDKVQQLEKEKEELEDKYARVETEKCELKIAMDDRVNQEKEELEEKCVKAENNTHELKLLLDESNKRELNKDRQLAEMRAIITELRSVGVELMNKAKYCKCRGEPKTSGKRGTKCTPTAKMQEEIILGTDDGGISHLGFNRFMSSVNWVLPNAFTSPRPPHKESNRGAAA